MQACPVQPQWKRPFPDRLVAALRLDATVFEEVEHDEQAIGQAVAVIFLASFAQGLGAIEAPSIVALLGGLMGMIAAGFVGWLAGTGVIWLIGVKLMGCASDYGELLRTIGFAAAPKILLLFGVVPLGPLKYVLAVAVMGLSTAASVIAVRQALDVTTGRAIMVCVLAMVVTFVLAATVGTIAGLTLGVVS